MKAAGRIHYGWVVIFMGLLTTIAAHGFGRMSYTIILPAMKDGLQFNYTQLGLLGTGNFIGYLTMAIIGGFLAARFGTRIVITLALVLEQAGLPVEGIALIIGVDRLLDMVRTAVNVTGDATVSVIVGKSENQFDEEVFLDPQADQHEHEPEPPPTA